MTASCARAVPDPVARPDWSQLRADALALVAEAALGRGLERVDHAEPYQVMVHVEAAALADTCREGILELEGGQALCVEGGRRLSCDAPAVTALHGPGGEVLHMGRKSRRVSTALWRALKGRDRTCRFPGCCRTGALQAHHIRHWAEGGETDPGNLLLLCRAHHWAVHEGGWRVECRAPGRPVFLRPDGRELRSAPRPVELPGDAVEALRRRHRRLGLRITAATPACNWDGGHMDYDLAVSGLQELAAGGHPGAGRVAPCNQFDYNCNRYGYESRAWADSTNVIREEPDGHPFPPLRSPG